MIPSFQVYRLQFLYVSQHPWVAHILPTVSLHFIALTRFCEKCNSRSSSVRNSLHYLITASLVGPMFSFCFPLGWTPLFICSSFFFFLFYCFVFFSSLFLSFLMFPFVLFCFLFSSHSVICQYYKKWSTLSAIKLCLAIFWFGFREFQFRLVGSVTRMIRTQVIFVS